MLSAFNQIWHSGVVPKKWKESIIIPIQKGAGQPNHEVSSFRPISLTSCVCKTMERMVNHRLITALEKQGSLHPRQFAFRKGKGIINYFAEFDDIISKAAVNGEHCEIVTLDIKKAYDRVWHRSIMEAVLDSKVGTRMNKFISSFLQQRSARVSFGGQMSRCFEQENGVPQGSVISVTLFLLAMNSLFEVIPKNVKVFVYADDIVIIATGKRVGFLRKILQKAVTAIEKRAKIKGFQMSPTKSTTMHCCKVRRHKNWHLEGAKIILDGAEIPKVKTTRILGIIFDKKCKINQHVKQLKDDCRSRLNLLKAISRMADRKTLLYIGNATITSKLMYGIELLRKENIEVLAPVYNQIIRTASGALKTSPVLPMVVESGCLPFKYVAVLTLVRKACSVLEKTRLEPIFLWVKADRIFKSLTGETLPQVCKRIDRKSVV